MPQGLTDETIKFAILKVRAKPPLHPVSKDGVEKGKMGGRVHGHHGQLAPSWCVFCRGWTWLARLPCQCRDSPRRVGLSEYALRPYNNTRRSREISAILGISDASLVAIFCTSTFTYIYSRAFLISQILFFFSFSRWKSFPKK